MQGKFWKAGNSRTGASLEQEWRPLRARIDDVSRLEVEVFPVVVDLADFVWVDVGVIFDIFD